MSNIRDEVEWVDGVKYTVYYGSFLRVVFKYNCSSIAIREVENIIGRTGEVGATQEHHACIDYEVDND